MDGKDKKRTFREFVENFRKISFTDQEKHMAYEGFMVGLGMYSFLYAWLTAPDFPTAPYLYPHGSMLLAIGFVLAIWTALNWQYLEWRKRPPEKGQESGPSESQAEP